jgi:hypothetical protein
MAHLRLEQIFKLREDVQIYLPEVRTNTLRHMSYRQAEAYVKVLCDMIGTYGLPIAFNPITVLDQIKKKSRSDWRIEELRDGKQRVWAAFLEILMGSVGHYSLILFHLYRSSKAADLHLLALLDQATTDYSIRMPDFRGSQTFFGAYNPAELVVPAKNQVVCEIDACFHLWNCYSKAAEKPNETHNRFAQSMARMVVKPTADDFDGLAKKVAERTSKRARRDPFSDYKPESEDDEPEIAAAACEEEEEEEGGVFAVPIISGGKGLSVVGAKGYYVSAGPPASVHHH